MRIRKIALAAVAFLLGGGALAFPTTASAALGPFTCGTQTGGTDINGNPTTVSAVRVGRHDSESPAYDRFLVEFSNGPVPKWTAIPKSSAMFWLQPSNQQVKLLGAAGIRLDFFTGTFPAYRGQKGFVTGFPQLVEARELEDFEGSVQWGLGLNHQSCKRIFELNSPTGSRLVIDVPQ
jgi:hypothetical protein